MDENTVRLLDLFGAYEPEAEIKELLADVRVYKAEVDMNRRSVSVAVQLSDYLPLKTVRKIEKGITAAYSIRSMELRTIYGAELLPALCCSDVGLYLSEQFAPSMSILAGCTYSLQ